MIDPKELRIGNIIIHKGQMKTVHGIDSIFVRINTDGRNKLFHEVYLSECEPVPIKQDLLIRSGFVIDKTTGNLSLGDITLEKRDAGYELLKGNVYIAPIETLHKLQNLHFAICQKEIEIKL